MKIKTPKTFQRGAYIYERGTSFIVRLTHNSTSYVGYIPFTSKSSTVREEAYGLALKIRERILTHIDALCLGIDHKLPAVIEYASIKTYAKR